MKVVRFIATAGGTGQSSLIANLAYSLVQEGKTVAILDAHPTVAVQKTLTRGFKLSQEPEDRKLAIFSLAEGQASVDGEFDWCLVDEPMGASPLLESNDMVTLISPEPTSFMAAYELIQSLDGVAKVHVIASKVVGPSHGKHLLESFRAYCAKYGAFELSEVGTYPHSIAAKIAGMRGLALADFAAWYPWVKAVLALKGDLEHALEHESEGEEFHLTDLRPEQPESEAA